MMTTYRVGAAGATVFNKDGGIVVRLRPGTVVVEGAIDAARLPAADRPQKRRRGYADKMQRVAEDKAL